MNYVKLGEILRRGRENSKHTQKEIAFILGVTPQNVSSWELGKSKVDIETYVNLCSAYGIDTQTPLIQSSENYSTASCSNLSDDNKAKNLYMEKYNLLNEQGQEKVNDYIDDIIETDKYKKHNQPSVDSQKMA